MALVHFQPVPPHFGRDDVVRFVCAQGRIDASLIGRVDLDAGVATVEVPDSRQARLLANLEGAVLDAVPVRSWSGGTPISDRDSHFQRLADLLGLESNAEAARILERARRSSARDAERSGDCLIDLSVQEGYAGLGGRYILTLVKRGGRSLPWTRIAVGTPVVLSPMDSKTTDSGERGVVCERSEAYLRVAVNEPPEEDVRSYRLDVAADQIARLRQRQALDRARNARGDRLAELRAVLLGDRQPEFGSGVDEEPLDAALDPSQLAAVRFALAAADVAVIHGPPGTGKTTTIVELTRRAVRRGDKVLICAPGNLAVDNVLERLLAAGENAIRSGHPARVLPRLREHTLDFIVEEHPDVRQARKFAKEAYALFRKAGKWTRAKPAPGARREQREEGRALLADARRMEAHAIEAILDKTPILCATTTGLDPDVIGNRCFDLLIIDESCQTTEPGCWIPIARTRRLVLAGDHRQLPPTVLSPEAARQGFGVSLLERLVELHGDRISCRLDVQYRMHEAIMNFSSSEFYDGTLLAHPSVSGHRLCDLPGVAATPLTENPVDFIDTAGAGYDEEKEEDGDSRFNPREATLVRHKVEALVAAGVAAQGIGVIAPYAAQVRLLRENIPIEGVEIDSVDGFQGREKEVVILSLVRSNAEAEIGFLADIRRTNVALTRARRKLIVIGDSATLSALPFYRRLFEYFESIGAYRTVWEEDTE